MEQENKFDLKSLIVGALLGSGAFIGKSYLEPYFAQKNKQEEFVVEMQKKLFDHNYDEFEKINSAYDKIYTFYENGYGFTSEELKPTLDEWLKTKESFEKYLREVERYGNSDEIDAAKQTSYLINDIYFMLMTNVKASENIEHDIKNLSYIDGLKNDQLDQTFEKIFDNDLELLINTENHLYYDLRFYKKIFDGLRKYSDHRYKSTLHLEDPQENLDAIKMTYNLYKNRPKESIYKNSDVSYYIANNRKHLDAQFKTSANSTLETINKYTKNSLLKKILEKYFHKDNPN